MKEKLLWGSLIFLMVYMLLPWILTRMLGLGVYRKGGKGQIALTFDDGPDPEYTPKLLDLLKEHSIKATFFVLGAKAERNPELIKRIHDEGHQIGVHNYVHFSNWLMTPWRVKKYHVNRSADIVESITGVRPTYYRPPWGIINIFDFFLKGQYQIVLWSVMAHDWSSRVGRTDLKQRLTAEVTDGSIILLHDSGQTLGADQDAPSYMLQALSEVLEEFKQKQLSFVRVDEMMNRSRKEADSRGNIFKRGLVTVFMLWEKLFIKIFGIIPVDPENTFLQIRLREYHGSSMVLGDGVRIEKGDLVAEMHLNNDTLYQLGRTSRNAVHLAIQMIRRTEQILPQIATLFKSDPGYKDVKGLYGVSLINRGLEHLGFTVLDLPKGPFSFFTKIYLRFLMYVVHSQGRTRLKQKTELLVPKIICISAQELENRYAA
ncbi:polysaccharide deacetylase family protein [Gorillibacterium massiliense]|uniref:polysaccharide deacetylase family protein n=1 Tax=Gorillibacterium massiliense TaxID=1280390 RepID=UPI0004B14CCE|nr:polysaccharide deacetylase family protein [Gorillibacterium massiliense]